MNKHRLMALAIAAMPMAAGAEVTLATLFPSHADLTWEERKTVAAGTGVVEITGLPVSLQEQSLQVAVAGVAGARILQVQVNQVEQAEFVAADTRRIRHELTRVSRRIEAQEDAIRAWNQQVTLMTKAAETPQELSASELKDLAAAVKESTQNALTEIRSIRATMADDLATRDRLQRELSRIKQGAKATKKVLVRYQAQNPGELQVSLRFQTPEAGWRSEYNARLQVEADTQPDGELVLEHMAVVRQTTGTDWDGVQLHLATANARRGTAMPPLHSWVVSPQQPQPYRMKSAAPLADMQAEALMGSSAVVERQSTFTQSYRLPQPVAIPSGTAGQRLTVAHHRIPVTVATWTAPVLDPTGYVYATGKFTADAPIPAGRVTLYRDAQSVGEYRLPELADGEELTLGFGVDEALRVAVINELELSGEEGLWKSENVQRRQNRFELTNHHPTPIQVRVFDRLPVSQEDILTVKPLQISEPVVRDVDDKKGVLAWERTVPAGGTVSVKSGFEVRVPEGTALPEL
ncbi:DUF4139 domain-containing protein [Marinobacter sp. X15-166B]|uniref:DUF4139 domain-containing protein n=1 Tax=Marinobacter sp. X15-166B TaxID=1897620 RepID=UPI00085C8459|nr:DUF4139 domain-containing protein [Marinobacter sp. X15-166B]OEY67533.1 hypothetical protein BG841_14550 [Marinobacter sp. X15-166B]